jgi:hypothetical protein
MSWTSDATIERLSVVLDAVAQPKHCSPQVGAERVVYDGWHPLASALGLLAGGRAWQSDVPSLALTLEIPAEPAS